MERHLAAILAADVVGYSRLMEHAEADTFERLRAHHKELFEPEIVRHQGRIFKLMGDGLLAEFGSVVDAVECAVALQRGLAERNANIPDDQRIDIRIGINLGEVIVEGDDRYGEGVNIAARLEQIAGPGGIYVSDKVAREVEKKLAFGFEPMGTHHVKNIAEPIMVYRVLVDGVARRPRLVAKLARIRRPQTAISAVAIILLLVAVGAVVLYFYPRPLAPIGPASIAVLPFVNMSGDPNQEYFSDGVTNDIITQLSKFEDLMVIASNSTATYKGKTVTPEEIGRALHVRYVIQGSVARSGDRLRIGVQVTDAGTGRQVWGESYDEQAEDLFVIRDEVTSKIVGTLAGLQGQLTKAAIKGALGGKETKSLDAYTLVLRGDDLQIRFTKEDNLAARQFFMKALEIDPNYALAYADLAWNQVFAWQFGWNDEPERSLGLALEYAERAVALDDFSSEGHWALGYVVLFRRQYDRSLAEYARARAITPNYADLLADSATPMFYIGRPQEGIDLVRKAIRLNPYHPSWYSWVLGQNYYAAGEYEQAIHVLSPIRDPFEPRLYLIACHVALGLDEEARTEASNVMKMMPNLSLSVWGKTQPFKNQEDLHRLLEALKEAGLPP